MKRGLWTLIRVARRQRAAYLYWARFSRQTAAVSSRSARAGCLLFWPRACCSCCQSLSSGGPCSEHGPDVCLSRPCPCYLHSRLSEVSVSRLVHLSCRVHLRLLLRSAQRRPRFPPDPLGGVSLSVGPRGWMCDRLTMQAFNNKRVYLPIFLSCTVMASQISRIDLAGLKLRF